MNDIEDWYDNKYDEWSRLDRHKIEFEITKRYLKEYIIGENLKILDIGGGPGRYSFYLAEQGHQVTLFDLSRRNLEVAKEKSKELGISLVDYIKGNALELEKYEGIYDVVLLMGPMYHLIKEEDRIKALQGALDHLKEGGILITSFISSYAPIQDCLSYLEFEGKDTDVSNLLGYLDTGINKDGEGFTTAYFTGIEEAKDLMSSNGVRELAFAGVENLICCKEREILALSETEIKKWVDLAYALSKDPYLLGTCQHFLHIGRKEKEKF